MSLITPIINLQRFAYDLLLNSKTGLFNDKLSFNNDRPVVDASKCCSTLPYSFNSRLWRMFDLNKKDNISHVNKSKRSV